MTRSKTWREIAKPIIADVLRNTENNLDARKKALFDAYPFGERNYHPYKIWLDEIKVQTQKKKFGTKNNVDNPNQQNLF